ncbi:MAG: protein adenylyltransferase SelO family protein [Niameybacter sp.]|uniref:protein adenylyltransferase SelO family protein n=2 Tax=Niameybacter sp. TaxID=2033640 RepID=UPI002FC6D6F4
MLNYKNIKKREEYIISEAMYALGIPTTRSLAVVATGEEVVRQQIEKGAVLVRMAGMDEKMARALSRSTKVPRSNL